MARNLDTALLRAFLWVAETGGMTSAASGLNLTQAAVSQQIKRLEEAFGRQLFERGRRGLALTPDGERLFDKAKRMIALNDSIWAEMTTPDYTGELRLGIPHDYVAAFLPPILKSFTQACPQVRISLDCRTSPVLKEALVGRELDLAIATATPGDGAEILYTDRLVWVGARGGEACRRRPLPVSIGSETCAFRGAVLTALREAEIEWRPVSEISNVETMNATVETDLAVMALLATTVPQGLEILGRDGGLPPLPTFSIGLYLPTQPRPVAQELARHVRDAFNGRLVQAA